MSKPCRFKNLLKPFTIYTGANFINEAITFFLLPVLTRFLTPYSFGILATYMSVMRISDTFVLMNTGSAVTRYYADKAQTDFDFPKFVSNAIFVNSGLFLIMAISLFFFRGVISEKLFISYPWLLSLPFIGLCVAVHSISFRFFVCEQRPLPYAILRISNTLIEMLLSIYFVVAVGLNWQGRAFAILGTKILFFGLGLFILFRYKALRLSFDHLYIKRILSYGVPVTLHSLDIRMAATVDRLFLNRLVGLAATGVYGVAYSISAVIDFILGSFNFAWAPFFYEKLNNATQAIKIRIVRFSYLFFIGVFLLAIGLIFVSPYFLKYFVGASFRGAAKFIFWIALGYAFHGIYTMSLNYILYQKKTFVLTIIGIVTIIFNIVFNYTLISLNGAIGAAQATFLTFFIRALLVWCVAQKVYPMPWFAFSRLFKRGEV